MYTQILLMDVESNVMHKTHWDNLKLPMYPCSRKCSISVISLKVLITIGIFYGTYYLTTGEVNKDKVYQWW